MGFDYEILIDGKQVAKAKGMHFDAETNTVSFDRVILGDTAARVEVRSRRLDKVILRGLVRLLQACSFEVAKGTDEPFSVV